MVEMRDVGCGMRVFKRNTSILLVIFIAQRVSGIIPKFGIKMQVVENTCPGEEF